MVSGTLVDRPSFGAALQGRLQALHSPSASGCGDAQRRAAWVTPSSPHPFLPPPSPVSIVRRAEGSLSSPLSLSRASPTPLGCICTEERAEAEFDSQNSTR